MDELAITVSIANRQYKLSIDKNTEEFVRKASKKIDDKIKEYTNLYSYKDYQDLLAMIALEFTTMALNYEDVIENSQTKLEEKILSIDDLLA